MLLRILPFLVASPILASTSPAYLPAGASISSFLSDSAGNLFFGGSWNGRGFVTGLSPDGSTIRFTYLTSGTGGQDSIAALALGSDGSVYAAGSTFAADSRAFALKLDRNGNIQYAITVAHVTSSARAIAVNAAGEALIGGQIVDQAFAFATTPGTVSGGTDANTGFLVKLDASGSRILLAARGFATGAVAYDASGNLYAAGAVYGTGGINATNGAFQSTHDLRGCAGTGFVGIACFYQALTKISPDGTKLIYSTFVTGTYGATPAALVVDSAGNALLAGNTNSSDYPVTPGVFQTAYKVTNSPASFPLGATPHPPIYPPPSTGYLTKVNAAGTGLVWSTFFSGTGAETITDLRIDPQNRMVIGGISSSRDLPGAQTVPGGCTPGPAAGLPYIAILSADATTLIGSRFLYGMDTGSPVKLAPRAGGGWTAASNDAFQTVDLTGSTPLACMIDPADNAPITRAAAGQLITLFGDNFGGEGASVTIDGIAAPLLYNSMQQINVQVPAELAGRDVVTLSVSTADGSTYSRAMRVVANLPSAFLVLPIANPFYPEMSCKGESFYPAFAPVATNADGTLNSCSQPAFGSSVATFYLNGLGPGAHTVTSQYASQNAAFLSLDDLGSRVWALRVQLPASGTSAIFAPLIDGIPLREDSLGLWMR